MDSESSTRPDVDLLERMLFDETAKPTSVPLLLLENITNCFSDDRRIGSGGFAVVYKGIVGKGMIAVKKLTKYDLPEKKFLGEVECLIKAKHKNIVRFLGYCYEMQGEIEDFKGKTVISDIRNWLLCFEYVPNGSLDNYITDASHGLEWRKRYEIIKGICEGLLHLHDKRILHLDLKPGNILLDEHMVPKIADFGLSVCLREDQNWASTLNLRGTLGYLPQEVFAGQKGFSTDIYSLGVIIVEIVTGQKRYPEYENVVENWMNRLEGSDQSATQLDQVKLCTNIGIECMDIDPKKRPDARHIIDRLNKTASTIETIISSSLLDQHVSFPKDQYCQEKNSKLLSKDLEMDTKESAEMEELAEYGWTHRVGHCQQGQEETPVDQWLLWRVRDRKQNVSPQGARISGSNSGVLYKLKNLSIFNRKARREFLRSGGSILRNSAYLRIFRKGELKQILKDEKFIGKSVFGEVYKGLVGNVPVVVMKQISDAPLDKNQFISIVQSRVRHKNIVEMIGVCLEADVPMLVYEFLSSSLHDILHMSNLHLSLGLRLSIAADSAGGLAYIHSDHVKSLHGNLKPTNIFLDHKLVAKIWDFGISMMFGVDTQMIGSDITYTDPVYLQTGVLTTKSDVYSFGVVILELLTRKKATHDDNNGLVRKLLENHEMGRKSTELFDQKIAAPGDLEFVDSLAEIVMECLSQDMDLRPTMVDVAKRLSILSKSYELALSGSIISGSISGVPNKLKNRSISNEKVQKEILRYGGSSLTNLAAMSFISTGILKEFLKDEKFIGKGAFGEVYKGLAGDEPVVVMKLISDDVLDINQFVREFSIQSCARHKNIVKMIGVCLDADVPMLVYEFLCNGSLHEILHRSNLHLSLGLRLSIAADSAGGLAYIHSDHVKSLHGNLTPTNIFLDHKLVAKILDFGISRMFGVGTEMIGGDITYTDPVYLQTGLLTTKSDVYSFGVVILELLTRKKATHDDNNGLVRKLLENHKMGRKSTELFDQELAAPGDLEFVDNLAEIAMECLSQDTDLRPTMADVAKRLSILSKSYELVLLQKATS